MSKNDQILVLLPSASMFPAVFLLTGKSGEEIFWFDC